MKKFKDIVPGDTFVNGATTSTVVKVTHFVDGCTLLKYIATNFDRGILRTYEIINVSSTNELEIRNNMGIIFLSAS